MNIEILKAVADHIRNADHIPLRPDLDSEECLEVMMKKGLKGFNMESPMSYDQKCGSAGCIAGWTLFEGLRRGLLEEPHLIEGWMELSEAAAEILDIDDASAYCLFQPDFPVLWNDIKPKQAAAVLDELSEVGARRALHPRDYRSAWAKHLE